MGESDIRNVIELENNVKVGDTYLANWTNSGYLYSAIVEVVTINPKSFGVKLVQAIDGYPVGHHLNIPRFMNQNRWSWNNRLGCPAEVKA